MDSAEARDILDLAMIEDGRREHLLHSLSRPFRELGEAGFNSWAEWLQGLRGELLALKKD